MNDPAEVEADLVAYYDGEGDERSNRPIDPQRLEARARIVGALRAGSRVLEVGSGPGRDAVAFLEAGHDYAAVDLSFEHLRRCRATGAPVARASVRQLPWRDGAFDLVWTMSTLMHVPQSAIDVALAEVARVLTPGGIAAIGVWGGADVEDRNEGDVPTGRPPRLFSRRSDERWRSMLGRIGVVETFEAWSYGTDFSYQWAVVRSPAS